MGIRIEEEKTEHFESDFQSARLENVFNWTVVRIGRNTGEVNLSYFEFLFRNSIVCNSFCVCPE